MHPVIVLEIWFSSLPDTKIIHVLALIMLQYRRLDSSIAPGTFHTVVDWPANHEILDRGSDHLQTMQLVEHCYSGHFVTNSISDFRDTNPPLGGSNEVQFASPFFERS